MHLAPNKRKPRRWFFTYWAVGLLGLLAIAAWLRWQFVRHASLDVDEYTTLWAARRILESGTPSMPSGVVYTRGLLNMYITALFGAVGGLNATIGRLPSVLFGLASIVTIFSVGQAAWKKRVGWLVALAVVFHPVSIQWDSTARFYAQLVFFTLLTAYSAFQIARMGEKPPSSQRQLWAAHLFFALFFVLALFSQELTILFYPALVVALLWWRGWRYFFQPAALTAQAICVAAMIARYLFEIFGQPGYFTAIQAHKSYIAPNASWVAIQHLFLPILPPAWIVLVPLAALVTVFELRKGQWRPERLPRFHQATLFFLLEFLIVTGFLVFVVGPDWQGKRFGLMLQPWWLLVGAAGAIWLVDRISTHGSWRLLTTIGLSLLVVWPLWPQAQRLVARTGEGYDAAFAFVAAQRQPSDIVMTPQPPACVFILGEPCDYYARESGYEPYVIAKNGVLVDRWSGSPLLDSAAQLETVIRGAPNVWFVTDRERLSTRYDEKFLRLIVEQFDLAFEERDVLVLVARGWDEPPAYALERAPTQVVESGPFRLSHWERSRPTPGEMLHVMLSWELVDIIDQPIHTSLQLVGADGQRITQADSAPADDLVVSDELLQVTIPDYKRLMLPADLPPGLYRLEVIAYTVADQAPLADPLAIEWLTIGSPPPQPAQVLERQWQHGLRLLGYDDLPQTLTPNATLDLRLVWSTVAQLHEDYTAFVHLIGPDGAIVAQNDRPPLAGFYPTAHWRVHDIIEDHYSLTLPSELLTGTYQLQVGWYQPLTGIRLPFANAADAVEIAQWTVPE